MVTRGGSRAGSTGANRDGTQNGNRRVRARSGSSNRGGRGDEFADERADLEDVLRQGLDDVDLEMAHNERGSNIPDPLPAHPDQREMIFPLNSTGFTNIEVDSQIVVIFKSMFNGPWTSWRQVTAADRRLMWERFCGLYQWATRFDAIIEKNWEKVLKARYHNIMSEARKDAKKKALEAGTSVIDGDYNVLKPYPPTWIDAANWEIMIDKTWSTEKWQKKSKVNRKDAKHTAGSIGFEQPLHRMWERLTRQLEDRVKIAEERKRAADESEKTIMERIEVVVAGREEKIKELEGKLKELNEMIRQQRGSRPSNLQNEVHEGPINGRDIDKMKKNIGVKRTNRGDLSRLDKRSRTGIRESLPRNKTLSTLLEEGF